MALVKEKIILATLDLASKYGLGSLSMSQIAEAVGIKKPSLYNHFTSKDELIGEMYRYLREISKSSIPMDIDFSLSADAILYSAISNYLRIVRDEKMYAFYKVIYSERSINPLAAKIMVDETDKMIAATKDLLTYLDKTKKLHIDNVDMVATNFALSIHALIDYRLDCEMAGKAFSQRSIEEYIKWFCKQYK